MLSLQPIRPKMKQSLYKIYLVSFFILSDFTLFAQGPGDESDGDPLEGGDGDAPPTPINGKITWLFLLAILYGIYFYNSHYRKSKKA